MYHLVVAACSNLKVETVHKSNCSLTIVIQSLSNCLDVWTLRQNFNKTRLDLLCAFPLSCGGRTRSRELWKNIGENFNNMY
jgi:hypothetical protein